MSGFSTLLEARQPRLLNPFRDRFSMEINKQKLREGTKGVFRWSAFDAPLTTLYFASFIAWMIATYAASRHPPAVSQGAVDILGLIFVALNILTFLNFVLLGLLKYLRPKPLANDTSKGYSTKYNNLMSGQKSQHNLETFSHKSNEGFEQPEVWYTSPDDLELIRQQVLERVSSNLIEQIASEWDEKYRSQAIDDRYIQRVRETASAMQARLREEIEALGRRANLNLGLGMVISMLGLTVLGLFVYLATKGNEGNMSSPDIAIQFSIRFSLVVVIQIFAYFFLRLYRSGIFEIKYFQNEITNVELKVIALEAILRTNDKRAIASICSEIAKTERNFLLKKGETTMSLRREEIERDYDLKLNALFKDVLERKLTRKE
jgi:hypothetical protein